EDRASYHREDVRERGIGDPLEVALAELPALARLDAGEDDPRDAPGEEHRDHGHADLPEPDLWRGVGGKVLDEGLGGGCVDGHHGYDFAFSSTAAKKPS